MTIRKSRQIHLGLFLQAAGHHVAGWQYPGAQFGSENLQHIIRVAQIAEAAKFDAIFLSDNMSTSANEHPSFVARLEPLTLLSALAQFTSRIGLIATASTTYGEPFHVARAFASLDLMSGGRTGWNVVTSFTADSAKNFSRSDNMDHAARYGRAEEFVDVVRGLWDSWEAEPYVADRESGQYIDKSKVHELNHVGEHFQVKGPLNVTRSPQGQPVLVQAGSSDSGQNLASRIGELIFTAQQDLHEAQQFYRGLKALAVEHGRDPAHCLVMPGVMPIIGRTSQEAKEKYETLKSFISDDYATRILSMRLGHDVSAYPLDGPVPADLPVTGTNKSRAELLLNLARRENLTLRELYHVAAAAHGHKLIVGSGVEVADMLEHWFAEGAADGFNIMPPYLPGGLEDFAAEVVPILQERGLYRKDYTGSTLRAHLGLPIPANRYTVSG